jgi:hypothetical protein
VIDLSGNFALRPPDRLSAAGKSHRDRTSGQTNSGTVIAKGNPISGTQCNVTDCGAIRAFLKCQREIPGQSGGAGGILRLKAGSGCSRYWQGEYCE